MAVIRVYSRSVEPGVIEASGLVEGLFSIHRACSSSSTRSRAGSEPGRMGRPKTLALHDGLRQMPGRIKEQPMYRVWVATPNPNAHNARS